MISMRDLVGKKNKIIEENKAKHREQFDQDVRDEYEQTIRRFDANPLAVLEITYPENAIKLTEHGFVVEKANWFERHFLGHHGWYVAVPDKL